MRAPRSRRLLVALDLTFGLVLLIVAFGPALLVAATRPPTAAPTSPRSPELIARLNGIAPPGQATGFAVAPDGSLGIVDRGRGVVVRLDAMGRLIGEWGPRFGAGLDAQELGGLASEPDGWYVLDRAALRVLHLDTNGRVQPDRTVNLQPLSPYGPNGLAADPRANLYVADTGRDRILVFDDTGRPLTTIGDSGRDVGKLKQPMGLSFAADGSLLVADWENSRIAVWSADYQPLTAWQLPAHAWGVAADAAGRVYVPDGDQRLVRVFSADGQQLFELGGSQSGAPLPIDFPSQVAVSPDGATLWVLGSDGLSKVDLQPYAAIRPTAPAVPVRWPLAIAALALLASGGAAVVAPRAPTWRRPRTSAPPSPPPPVTRPARPAQPPRRLFGVRISVPERVALMGGGVLLAVGGLTAIFAELRVLEPITLADPWPRLALLAAACLACAIGAALTVQVAPLQVLADWPGCPDNLLPFTARQKIRIAASFAPSILLALVAAAIWWQQGFKTADATRAAFLWLGALGVAIVATASRCEWRLPRISVWACVPFLLYALALAPRIWNQADLPYGVWFDEAQAGTEARQLLLEARYTPITDTFGRDASLCYYFVALAQQVISDPVLAGRTVSALIGALNAPLLYFLGRELWGRPVGLAAGVLLAASRWHINVSRLGWDPISLPVCVTLGFWLLARAVRREQWTDAAWAGMAFGLGLHGYIGFRAMPVVAAVLLIYAAWLRRWRLPASAIRGGIVLATAVLVGLPVLIFAIQDPASFNGRLGQTLILNQDISQAQKLDELWSNVQKHALMFHVRGDMNGRHNLPGWPMLDPFSGVLAMFGLAWLVVHLFDWRAWLVFGWSIVSMSGGIFTLSFEAPQAMRTLAMTPVLALLTALGVVLLLDRLSAAARGHPVVTRAGGVAAATLVVGIGVLNVYAFFAQQMQDPTVWESFSTRETIPMRAALDSKGAYESILGSPTIAPSQESALLAPNLRDSIRAFDATTDLPYRGAGPALIVLETEHDAALADEVARYYPEARRVPVVAPNAVRPLVEQLILDREVLAVHRGMVAVEDGWRVLLALDVAGPYRFDVPEGATLSLDGSRPLRAASFELARGNHLLELRGLRQPTLRWQPPGAPELREIDPRVLFAPPDGGPGLLATLFPTQTFQGSPRDDLIDPLIGHYWHSNPFARVNFDAHNSWSAEWRGLVDVPTGGTYRFEAERISRAGLWIDNQVVFDETAEGAAEMPSGTAELSAGPHDIRVRFQNRSEGGPRLYLYWTPPGGARQVVPGRVLYLAPALPQ